MRDRLRAAPALVGRDGELAELLAGLDAAAGGSGRLFLLAGDPGIGKSRLAGEAAARARDRGVTVAWGRCWEAGGAPAYWPWVQALRTLVRGVDSEQLRAQLGAGAPFVAQIVAEVAELLPDVRPPLPMGAEGARFRLFDAVAGFLRNAGAGQPLMLVLDDLHAADAPSILLLRFAARELGEARVVVLGAYRDIELTAAIRWPSRWRSCPGNLRPGTFGCPAWMRPAWPASSGRSPGWCRGRAWWRPCTAAPRATRCSWGGGPAAGRRGPPGAGR